MKLTAEQRFWSRVDKSGECWEWTGGKNHLGYGNFKVSRRVLKAHRFSYELQNGAIESGRELDHICRNRTCVNPAHLRPTTHKQNMENQSAVLRKSSTSIRGVYLENGKYRARVKSLGKNHHVGYFLTLAEAEAAVVAKRNELFTHNDLDKRDA